ncbi:hypothetical protein D0859_04674 [Hortaea werneckii]|uniref:Uncharacterized protein n=1 Tax=Hortaea werneckii TaxID=91943 RepID=A0A3M7J0H6_HORWE|nr:hypothetical protein D0859_04674 [Hortaea werneckii]
MANFRSKINGTICTDDDIISSLATLCLLYEQQSIVRSKLAMAHPTFRLQNEICPSLLRSDYANDEIWYQMGSETTTRIHGVTMGRYKDWLRWCDRNFIKLDFPGGRRNYTEYGWHLVSMFEDKVDELRSGAEIWYTAPEEPAETL